LEYAVRSDPTNAGNWYLLAVLRADDGQADAGLVALHQGILLDRPAPFRTYALGEALAGKSTGDAWSDLGRVYAQWNRRYPELAEWSVAVAIVACEGQGNRSLATASLERGMSTQAQPATLIDAYRKVLTSPGALGPATAARWPGGC
jgi:hypothetical protein